MKNHRQLAWDNCDNVRDLGGLPTADGRRVRWGALVRSDHPSKLTAAGWQALYDHGIRTIISLRSYGRNEDIDDAAPRPPGLDSLTLEIEDLTEEEFLRQWVETNLWCTPLYYRDALQRWPERHAAVVQAVAHAQPGGVLLHCGRGYDRTGIITMVLLGLLNVPADEIAADYALSADDYRDKLLEQRGTTTHEVFTATLAALDLAAHLQQAGGLQTADIEALRQRALEPEGGTR